MRNQSALRDQVVNPEAIWGRQPVDRPAEVIRPRKHDATSIPPGSRTGAITGCGLADLNGIIDESYSSGSIIALTIGVYGRALVAPLKIVLKDSTSP
jgi:hypothetical protein